MKIVCVDNFDRETVSDILICDNITSEQYGQVMIDSLNLIYSKNDSPDYFKLVPDDYKLYVFQP